MFRIPATLALLFILVCAPLAAGAQDSHATVIMYHRFGDSRYPSTNVTMEQFAAHIEALEQEGFEVRPVGDIVDALVSGSALPEKTIGITVDDAFLSLYENGWPVFRDRNFPFTLFVSTDAIDNELEDYMSWDQIRELVSAGVTIGSQTVSHPHMTTLDAAEVSRELVNSMDRIEAETGVRPSLFAYPYGEYSLDVVAATEDAGFMAAFAQHSGVLHENAPLFELPRFALNEAFGSEDRFRNTVLASLPLVVSEILPRDPVLSVNPPVFGFTVDPSMGNLDELSCYASGDSEAAELILLPPRRVEVRLTTPFPRGRARINCTLRTTDGRWRWFGRQFYIP